MITDKQLAQLCADIYDPIVVGSFDSVHRVGEVVFGLKVFDGQCIVAFQGTQDAQGLIDDIDVIPHIHPRLGELHSGFYDDMNHVMYSLPTAESYILTGHSLGAARAAILAGLLINADCIVRSIVLFGCPRPGGDRLASVLAEYVGKMSSYKNGLDPIPLLTWPRIDPVPLTHIHSVPKSGSTLDPINWHGIQCYIDGVC